MATYGQMSDPNTPINNYGFETSDSLKYASNTQYDNNSENWIGFIDYLNWDLIEKSQQVIFNTQGSFHRVYLKVKNAEKVHLYFDEIPFNKGVQLVVYPGNTSAIGPYTNQYPTQQLTGLPNTIIIETFIPSGFDGNVKLKEIGIEPKEDFQNKSSGPCMVDINCTEGNDWQEHKRSVVKLIIKAGNQLFTCTGSIVNNTQQDKTPYMLTAHHCIENSSDEELEEVTVEFNFESEICDGDAPLVNTQKITQTKLLSESPLSGGSDFALFLLEDTIPSIYEPYFAGWDRTNTGGQSGVGIHHPNGDIKKVSTYTTPTETITMNDGETNAFWVMNWIATDNGHSVTSFGSSGSPLFDENQRIIGTLSGGQASCGNTSGQDAYGKFHYHWDKVGNDSTSRLSDWLDPTNTGIQKIDGFGVNAPPSEPDTIDLSNDFEIIPLNNPYSNELALRILNEESTLYQIDLVEAGSGKVVYQNTATVEFQADISFPLNQKLSNGIYILRVYNSTTFSTVTVAVYQNQLSQ